MSSTVASVDWVASSLDLVGEFFGVSRRTVAEWRVQGMPGSEQKWPLDQISRWRYERLVERHRTVLSGGRETKTDLEMEKLREDIRAKRLMTDIAEGHLVHRDEVVQDAVIMLTYLKSELQRIPEDVSLDMPKQGRARVKGRFARRIAQSLKRMSIWEPKIDIRRGPESPVSEAETAVT